MLLNVSDLPRVIMQTAFRALALRLDATAQHVAVNHAATVTFPLEDIQRHKMFIIIKTRKCVHVFPKTQNTMKIQEMIKQCRDC